MRRKEGYKPEPIWEGEDAYVIGGGNSLRDFDWDLLRGRNTIGCNSAYLHGPDICRVCFFGDRKFFDKYRAELARYVVEGGEVITNCTYFFVVGAPWLKVMRRLPRGMANGDTLGWNWSSGAAATNLALLFGAKRVFLLGIDLRSDQGVHNWHERQPEKFNPGVYQRFTLGFELVKRDLKKLFPEQEVIQITDLDTSLKFPVETTGKHFATGDCHGIQRQAEG